MIPAWNNIGALPPIAPGAPGHSSERSPYAVNIHQIVGTFGFTERRRTILRGVLGYRESMYRAGITRGFQWIDGSFIEDVETLENRDPNDLDVVTFFHLPQGMDQREFFHKHGDLFRLDQLERNTKSMATHVFWVNQWKVVMCNKCRIGTVCGHTGVTDHGKDFYRLACPKMKMNWPARL